MINLNKLTQDLNFEKIDMVIGAGSSSGSSSSSSSSSSSCSSSSSSSSNGGGCNLFPNGPDA